MILHGPTGVFARLLPQDEDDSRSVTFAISNKPPPPVVISFVVKAPVGIIFGEPPVEISNRTDFGPLIFTLVEGNSSFPGSNRLAFEAGEVIEFDDSAPTAEPKLPTGKLVVQHNINTLDLDDLGLTETEIEELGLQSAARLASIRAEISALQSEVSGIVIQIRENQKAINEARKAIKAVMVVYDISSGGTNSNEIYDKLVAKLDELEGDRDNLNASLSAKANDLQAARDDLVNVSQLVK